MTPRVEGAGSVRQVTFALGKARAVRESSSGSSCYDAEGDKRKRSYGLHGLDLFFGLMLRWSGEGPRSECLTSLSLDGLIVQVNLLSVRGGCPAQVAVCNLVEQKRD